MTRTRIRTRFFWLLKNTLNRVTSRMARAGHGPFSLIRHVGPKSGRTYETLRERTEQERGVPPHWLPYFTVESADETARQATHAGGRTLVATSEGHIGRFAVIADPQGAPFAVVEGETDP
jgi:hypothetical protein